ncbi:MAG: hypothetical protein ACKO47_03220, partial [Alphaproteobacteria bacterium]
MASIFDGLASLFASNQANNSSSQKVSTAEKPPAISTDSQNNQKNFLENIGDSFKEGIESVVSGKLFQSQSQPQMQPQTQSQIGPKVGEKRKAENLFPDVGIDIARNKELHERQFQEGRLINPPTDGQKRYQL